MENPLHAQGYKISGTIHNIENASDEPGVIRIFLLTKNTFRLPFEGIREIVIKTKQSKNSVSFSIDDVNRGEYALRCFQDKDNDGELDRFLMVPKEPWCLSWKNNENSIPPKFDDVSFEVQEDTNFDLFLRK